MRPRPLRARLVGAAAARLFAAMQRWGCTLSCYQRSRLLVAALRLCGVPAHIRFAVSGTDARAGHCWVDALEAADPPGWDVLATGR